LTAIFFEDEHPQHKVAITKPFYLGKYEVTQEQWEAVMGSNLSYVIGPKNPVDSVNWDDCQEFLVKLNAKTGGKGSKFVLPTEAQWEYACRAGSTTWFSYGDDVKLLGEYAWCNSVSGLTHPVGKKKPNAWGLYDMYGNVHEWCSDWYGRDYYANSPPSDPQGPAWGSVAVVRGGSFYDGEAICRSASRIGSVSSYPTHIGFRVAAVPSSN
jgi:formylglycine-generating enzyme required for sulfatase activity